MNKENNNDHNYSGPIHVSDANVVSYINDNNVMDMSALDASDSIHVMNNDSMHLVRPLIIFWNPQEDITTFELAQCMPLLFRIYSYPVMPYDINKSEPFMRHFKINNPN